MNATTPHASTAVRTFAQQLSSTRRGARLARLLTAAELRAWQVSPSVVERAEQIVAELAANAALHGRVQGRDFRLALHLDPTPGLLRIAVTDARGDRIPSAAMDFETGLDSETGRGLLIVTALADRWASEAYPPGGKTIWAEIDTSTAHEPQQLDGAD
ncbi:ATP-binding protein [Streptomyces sp. NPDC047085]|uniref:ATP-binding protein n=1 Tax=Streptomyces sp. NPDC047085 TaxID=3155140 RepID=UPI0033CA59A6